MCSGCWRQQKHYTEETINNFIKINDITKVKITYNNQNRGVQEKKVDLHCNNSSTISQQIGVFSLRILFQSELIYIKTFKKLKVLVMVCTVYLKSWPG